MITRQELIELLCNLILDNPEQKQLADNILANLIRDRITLEDALEQYNLLKQKSQGYWVDRLKSKVVYEALKRYQKGELIGYDIPKMISSLITHSIIEIQNNPDVTKEDLGIPDLLDLLCVSLSNEVPSEFDHKLREVLIKYGYLNEKEGE